MEAMASRAATLMQRKQQLTSRVTQLERDVRSRWAGAGHGCIHPTKHLSIHVDEFCLCYHALPVLPPATCSQACLASWALEPAACHCGEYISASMGCLLNCQCWHLLPAHNSSARDDPSALQLAPCAPLQPRAANQQAGDSGWPLGVGTDRPQQAEGSAGCAACTGAPCSLCSLLCSLSATVHSICSPPRGCPNTCSPCTCSRSCS